MNSNHQHINVMKMLSDLGHTTKKPIPIEFTQTKHIDTYIITSPSIAFDTDNSFADITTEETYTEDADNTTCEIEIEEPSVEDSDNGICDFLTNNQEEETEQQNYPDQNQDNIIEKSTLENTTININNDQEQSKLVLANSSKEATMTSTLNTTSILRPLQESEFEIEEVRFDEVEGAIEIEHQIVVDLHNKGDFQITTHKFFKDNEHTTSNFINKTLLTIISNQTSPNINNTTFYDVTSNNSFSYNFDYNTALKYATATVGTLAALAVAYVATPYIISVAAPAASTAISTGASFVGTTLYTGASATIASTNAAITTGASFVGTTLYKGASATIAATGTAISTGASFVGTTLYTGASATIAATGAAITTGASFVATGVVNFVSANSIFLAALGGTALVYNLIDSNSDKAKKLIMQLDKEISQVESEIKLALEKLDNAKSSIESAKSPSYFDYFKSFIVTPKNLDESLVDAKSAIKEIRTSSEKAEKLTKDLYKANETYLNILKFELGVLEISAESEAFKLSTKLHNHANNVETLISEARNIAKKTEDFVEIEEINPLATETNQNKETLQKLVSEYKTIQERLLKEVHKAQENSIKLSEASKNLVDNEDSSDYAKTLETTASIKGLLESSTDLLLSAFKDITIVEATGVIVDHDHHNA